MFLEGGCTKGIGSKKGKLTIPFLGRKDFTTVYGAIIGQVWKPLRGLGKRRQMVRVSRKGTLVGKGVPGKGNGGISTGKGHWGSLKEFGRGQELLGGVLTFLKGGNPLGNWVFETVLEREIGHFTRDLRLPGVWGNKFPTWGQGGIGS